MKRILLYILPFFMLVGCGRHSVDSRLVQVNELANRNETDSAMVVLSSIEKQSLNEHNRHYYDLMSIKTRDKAYQDITGDTVITDIIDYFDGNGSDYEKGEAYYYGGRVYREMGDAPQALDYYQKAQDAYPNEHAFMKGKIASQMGQLFLELYMFDHAKPKFQEAIRYQKDCKDTRGEVLNYHSMGESYLWLNKPDSAMSCFNEALKLIDEIKNNKRIKIEIHTSIIDLYIKQKDFDNALLEFKHIEPYLHENSISNSTLATAINIYTHKKELDKAEVYSNRLVDTGTLYGKKFGYKRLLEIANYKQQKTKLYDYIQKYKSSLDSANNTASTNAVIHQNSLYNYALRERDNLRLKEEAQSHYFIIISSIFAIILVVLISLNFFHKNKSLRLELSLQLSNIEKIKNSTCLKNKEDVKKEVTKDDSIKKLKESILLELNSLTEKTTIQDYKIHNDILFSSVYAKFLKRVDYYTEIITIQDWQDLDILVNNTHKDFKRKLYLLNNKLSTQEYRICLLIKCGFSNKNISKIMIKAYPTIISNQKRLYEKISKQKGSTTELVRLIYCI